MLTYTVRRLLLMVPTLLGVLAVVFFTMAMAPGGFSGSQLNAEGAQTQGEEARRIQQYFARRYGYDQPAYVQFGRWLNLVSPVGFKMASEMKNDPARLAEAEQGVAGFPAAAALNERQRRRVADTALDAAYYLGLPPADVLDRLLTEPPEAAAAWFLEELDASEDATWSAKLAAWSVDDPEAARSLMLERVAFEVTGRDRVLLSRPTLKWPSLGDSRRGRPVLDLIAEALPVTLLLNVISFPLIYLVAVPTGLLAASRRGGWFDTGSGVLFIALWSFPVMFAGVLLIGYLANVQFLRWFPTGGLHDLRADRMPFLPTTLPGGTWTRGWLLDTVWHLVLPVVCMMYGGFAVLSKLTRGSVLDNLSQDYARTARAKGVPESDVLWFHVMRNSLLPLITVFVGVLPAMIAGSVIVETIFSLPGMGKLGVEAAFQKDREVIMGTTLIASLLTLVALLLRDLLYAVADPRVSYD